MRGKSHGYSKIVVLNVLNLNTSEQMCLVVRGPLY